MTLTQPVDTPAQANLRWPNFFVVGAQRAGTTSLYTYLNGHPDIFMPEIKEPHYFARVEHGHEVILRSLLSKVINTEEEYLELFKGAGSRPLLGEASPFYLYDPEAPARIKEKSPDARIIALLRDPIERAHSSYLVARLEGRETKSFYESVREDYARAHKALGVSYLYIELGLYSEQVQRYLDTFGPDRVRFYLYDDLAADAGRIVRDACDFLGVDFRDGDFFDATKKHGGYKVPRNRFVNFVMGDPRLRSLALTVTPRPILTFLRDNYLFIEPPKPEVTSEAREFLQELFREDVRRLEAIINRDLSHWMKVR
jgi:hypothetical protein